MPFTSVLVTGASSGIGAALARRLAAPGARLVLAGRDRQRLAAVSTACEAAGAAVEIAIFDVTDRDAARAAILAADDALPLDLAIVNAGISAGTGAGTESEEQLREITSVNVAGTINCVAPLLPRFQARRSGQLGLVASLAGYRGFPGAPAYCASKAWVKVYGEALRGTVAADGIGVSVICPGYVDTPMTRVNRFPMPFLMDAERAARIIARGLERNRARIAFPWPMAALVSLIAALPPAWIDGVMARLPRK